VLQDLFQLHTMRARSISHARSQLQGKYVIIIPEISHESPNKVHTMKAILFARVSTEEQKTLGHSLPAQLARLEQYCHARNLEITKTFSFDESAYGTARAEFDLVFEFIAQQTEKVALCCDKVDRLTRNAFDKRVGALYDMAIAGKIELHFTSENQILHKNSSAAEKLCFGMALQASSYVSNAISDNVKRSIEQKVRRGELSGRAPFGYKNVRVDGRSDIIVDEHASAIVRQVFAWYATGTHSMDTIREKLKAEHGIVWSKGYLDWALKNSFYYGEMVRKGKLVPHKYPPLVSRSLFDRVQDVKAGHQKKKAKYAGIPFAYRGLFRCDDCGMTISPERHKGGKFVYYSCTESKVKHGAPWVREADITEQLAQCFGRLKLSDDVLHRLVDKLREVHAHTTDFHTQKINEHVKEQRAITTKLEKMYIDKLDGKISDDMYDKLYRQFQEKLKDLERLLRELRAVDNDYYITASYVLDLASRLHDLFMSSEPEEKRHLINLLLPNPRLKGKSIVQDVRKPFDMIMECNDRQVWCAR